MTITKDGRVVSLPSDLVPGLRSARKFPVSLTSGQKSAGTGLWL